MKYILFVLVFIFNKCEGQNCWSDTAFRRQGITYILLGYEGLIDAKNERVLKDTFINWGDGSEPGVYWQVEYDYGLPGPSDWEMMRWIMLDSVPACFNGWQITKEHILDSGPQEPEFFFTKERISIYNPYHRSKLPKYSTDIYITDNKVECILNKDTLNKYLWIEYPELKPKKKKHRK